MWFRTQPGVSQEMVFNWTMHSITFPSCCWMSGEPEGPWAGDVPPGARSAGLRAHPCSSVPHGSGCVCGVAPDSGLWRLGETVSRHLFSHVWVLNRLLENCVKYWFHPDHVCLAERQSAALHRLRRGDSSSGDAGCRSHAADGHWGRKGEENLKDGSPESWECRVLDSFRWNIFVLLFSCMRLRGSMWRCLQESARTTGSPASVWPNSSADCFKALKELLSTWICLIMLLIPSFFKMYLWC